MKYLFRRKLFWGFIFLLLSISVNGQTFIVKPATAANDEGTFVTKLLLKKNEVFRLSWTALNGSDLNLTNVGAKLIIGRSSNTYNTLEVDVSGTRGDFIPNTIGLGPGRYYARITNSSARTSTEIQSDHQNNSESVIYSNEILLLVEASEAPAIIAPRGKITNPTPTFQWSSVTGVPSYWLIVSSTPFDIIEDDEGNISIEGATVVWQYITKNTSAEYGALNLNSPFNDEAPPLNAGQEYSYTILNVYEENNPVFTSPVFGGIVPFIFSDPNAVPKTTLNSPASEVVFFSERTITFDWSVVNEANNYTINLLQIVKQQGIDVTLPIWASTTTNTSIEYPAIENLKNGRYQWNIVTNNSTGGGTTSNSRFFNYKIETGEFAAKIQSNSDNSSLLGVELSARAISGGVSPSIPYFVQNETHYDSLVAGTYEFLAEKNGFENAKTQVTIRDGRQTIFTLKMNPLPSSIKGFVKDNNGENVVDASISIINQSTNEQKNVVTGIDGEFSSSLNSGSYTIEVSKPGYISPTSRSVTLDIDEQQEISDPFILTNDQATVTGVVYNDNGSPIQQANVKITSGSKSFETKTNGSGLYQFTVSSGSWTIEVQKIGFVKPSNQTISLSTGDVLQNQDFILTGNANQVTGFIRERITNDDGSIGTAPFEGITVRAVPNVGSVISTISEKNGQYTFSLKSGSYTIQANRTNYSSNQDRELVIGIAVGETISGMDFELIPNPSSISGTVSLSNGSGVAGASVTVPNVGTTTTTSSGYYTISVPSGSHVVSVSKSGLVSPEPRSVTVSAGQALTGLNFSMTPNAGLISGRITSSGEALANTSLVAINTTSGRKVQLINNLDGTYSFNVQSGTWYIKAFKSGFISDSTSSLSVGPGQRLINQNFSLVKNLSTVRGTVTDGVNPLRNTTVLISSTSGDEFNQTTISQLNGTYAFSIPAGKSYRITSSKDGFKNSSATTSTLNPEEIVNQNFILSANPSSVSGKVSVADKSILSNAKVVAINSNGIRTDSTTTKTDGSFLLGLNPDNYSLSVTKAGYTEGLKSTSLSIGQNLTGINFTVNENFAFISGFISDTDNNLVEQAFINISRNGGGGGSTVTDQNGAFTFSGLIGGTYNIQITKSGFIENQITRTINDGGFITLDQTIVPKNGTISGVISDENGVNLSDATVTAVNENGNEYSAITNNNGSYTLTSLELGNYTINASKTGYTANNAINSELTEANLTRNDVNVSDLIPNNVVISGAITNSTTSGSIKDVAISISGSRGSGFSLTNSNGLFSVSNLSVGMYTVIASKDGFKAGTEEITVSSGENSGTVNLTLIPNNGKITGVITDSKTNTLPFNVTVIAASASQSLTTQTDLNGEFTFEGIETGLEYSINTDIYRDGYENVETSISVPSGASSTLLSEELKVIVKKSSITGNTGVGETTVNLLNASDDQIIDLGSSDSDGNYTFDFIGEGSYKVVPKKLGYTFNPEQSSTITVDIETAATASFTAQANIATLDILVKGANDQGISNADVTIISTDTTIILTKKTDVNGSALFSDIQASTEYIVRATKEGFSSDPDSKNIALSSGQSTSSTFTLIANSSELSGIIKSQTEGTVSNLSSANITAILTTTGQSFETSSNNSGVYRFENLASGNYSIVASRSGFVTDTISVNINPGETVTAEDIILSKSSVDLRGVVQFKGSGVEGVQITAQSTSNFTATTNSSGVFRFPTLPIKSGVSDTTVYQVKITQGVFTKSYLVNITGDQVGTRINVPVTNLPSGKVELIVTDGVEPIPGAQITFGISGGESASEITGNDGAFESSDNLRKAQYTVSVAKEGFLYPQNTIRIELPSDTSTLNREVYLPYTQLNVPEILADQETQVNVVNRQGYDNSGTSGILFYKQASASQFAQVAMIQDGDTLRANIPAFGSVEEISFYTLIVDTVRNNNYLSSEKSIVPLASGILNNIRVTPTIKGQNLRAGDTYTLNLFVRDGINKSLEERFEGETPEGTIDWTIIGEDGGIVLSNQEETSITLEAVLEGTYQLQVSVDLEGITINRSLSINVTNIPLESITVGAPGKQVSNSSESLFSYSAIDTSGGSVILGNSLQWSVIPSTTGFIDERGLFQAANSSVIGTFKVQVSEETSNLSGISEVVELIARIEPEKAYTFTDGSGLQLDISEGSVDITSQLILGKTTPPATKKFVFAQGTDVSYTVSDEIYVLSFVGSDLKKVAELVLPEDSSLALNDGAKQVGRFNFTTLQWEVLDTTSKLNFKNASNSVVTNQLGQFAILAENEPLGLKYAAVLPSPFSPDVAPVKIGYWLDTAFPPAKVNIQIYNIRGELVRTILEDDLQQPGRYGSSSSTKELLWDGLTDSGKRARNGRYVIQIKAKDQQDEVVKLLQVILIK